MRLVLFSTLLIFLTGCSVIGPSEDDLGKRSTGTVMNDNRTKSLAIKNIRKAHPELEEAHLNVTSFNGVVLLTGQVPSQEAAEVAARVAGQVRNVRRVHNELAIAGPTSMIARSNDMWLGTKIKTQMRFSDETEANRIKVVTENGVVYLMGLLTRDEAERAVALTREVFGVQKIVTVFEYIN